MGTRIIREEETVDKADGAEKAGGRKANGGGGGGCSRKRARGGGVGLEPGNHA